MTSVPDNHVFALPQFGEGLLDIMIKRARLIDALRSGKYIKGTDHLWSAGMSARKRTFVDGVHEGQFCCIGVGCNLLGFSNEELDDEMTDAYLSFNREYRISDKQQKMLVAMNDGDSAGLPGKDKWGTMYGEPVYFREEAPAREFPQIARFLEIIWGFNA